MAAPDLPTVATLENGKRDLDFVHSIANDETGAADFTSPDGVTTPSVQKAVNSLLTITDRGDWAQSTAYAVKDVVTPTSGAHADTTFIRVTSGTSPASGTFDDEYDDGDGPWRIYQGNLASDVIFQDGGTVEGLRTTNLQYQNISTAKLASGIQIGVLCKTLSYSAGGIGGAQYKAVANGTHVDGVSGATSDRSFLQADGFQWELVPLFNGWLYPEWFGYAEGAASACFNAACKYIEYAGRGTLNGRSYLEYELEDKVILPDDTDISLEFSDSTIKRSASYTDDDNLFVGNAGSGRVTLKLGKVLDPVGIKGTALINIANRPFVELRGAETDTHGQLFRFVDCRRVVVIRNELISDEVAPASGSLMGEIKGSTLQSNVTAKHNYQKGARNFLKVETINDGSSQGIDISENEAEDTYDTALFCRMTGFGDNLHEIVTIVKNKFYNVGKAGLKFTAPSTAGSGILENAIISWNLVKGYGMVVASPGIIIGDLGLNPDIKCLGVNAVNNIVDGRNKAGNITSLTGSFAADCRGLRVVGAVDVVLSNNQTRYTPGDGLALFNCENITGSGNIIRKACQVAGAGSGGAHILSCIGGELALSVYETADSKDGLYINKSQDITFTGTSKDNEGYGVREVNDGASGLKAARNVYTIKLLGNTLGPILQEGDSGVNSSKQLNCWDDDGDRTTGTSARRNEVSASWGGGTEAVAGVNRNRGYMFWNQSGDCVEVYEQTLWVKYDGSAGTS